MVALRWDSRRIARLAARIGISAVVCGAAILAAATFAEAVDQTPKNGCTSPQEYTASLTSPEFSPGSQGSPVTFQAWFEIEGVNPGGFDETFIEFTEDGGQTWEPLDPTLQRLIDFEEPTSGESDQPFSNNGLNAPPSFEQYSLTLPPGDGPTVQIRFRFETGDTTYQGFRGVAIDQLTVGFPGALDLVANFNSPEGWSFGGPSGPGGPLWQILTNPQTVSVKSPEINPDLVTLPDAGALPPAFEGSGVAWLGNTASGTFCGPDFANRFDLSAPDTVITSGPPATTRSKSASLAFTSSEAGSSFRCSLDAAIAAPCSSPQSYSGLTPGPHTFQVAAIDAAGNVDPTPAVHNWTVRATLADLDRPTQGVDVNVQTASGTVLVGVRGAAARVAGLPGASQRGLTFVPLEEARQIPVGSFLNTRRGTVQMVSARSARRVQSGRFGGGLFQVLQSRARRARGLTELRLKGSSFRRCRTGRRGRAGAAQVSRRTIRRVRSNANGNFRTRGRHSAATVRGTVWTTADRCDGTLTTVKRGRVAVRDFRRKRTVIVRAGRSYLARAPG